VEGTHKLTGMKVAIKHIRRSDFEMAGVAFNGRELELLRGMHHPNVVQLFDCLNLPLEIVIVMELIPGGELFEYCMNKGALPEEEALRYFSDIVEAVDYIHKRGVVHRDLVSTEGFSFKKNEYFVG
jgi:serine/threonine protein kinase